MLYLGSQPIAGVGAMTIEQNAKNYSDANLQNAKNYSDANLKDAQQVLATISSSTPSSATVKYKENSIWFVVT